MAVSSSSSFSSSSSSFSSRKKNSKTFDLKKQNCFSFKYLLLLILVTIFASYFAYRRFRLSFKLPHFQQKMNLFSENAFYYSFFVEVVETDTLWEGVQRILKDSRSEYPTVVNAFRRFNIFQEFLLGVFYKIFQSFLENFFASPWNFYTFSVLLLNGFGVGVLALISAILGSSTLCGLCAVGFYYANFKERLISRISAVSLRENFGLPFLWLNIWIIICLLRNYKQKEEEKKEKALHILLFASSLCLILFWQFGVFILTTQCASVFAVLLLGYDVEKLTKNILKVYTLAYAAALVIQSFPTYLLLSFFPHTLLSIFAVLLLWPLHYDAQRSKSSLLKTNICRGLLSLVFCFLIRLALSRIDKDDSHVYQLLLAKLHLAPHTFDTKIYLMGGTEFDFFARFMYNLMVPSRVVYFSVGLCLLYICLCATDAARASPAFSYSSIHPSENSDSAEDTQSKNKRRQSDTSSTKGDFNNQKTRKIKNEEPKDSSEEEEEEKKKTKSRTEKIKENISSSNLKHLPSHPEYAFFLIQTFCFLALMLLIARLRVLCLPLLCALSGTFASPYLASFLLHHLFSILFNIFIFNKGNMRRYKRAKLIIKAFCFAAAFVPFALKLPWEEMSISAWSETMSSTASIAVVKWLNQNLPSGTSILTDIPMGGTLRASTRLSLIIHPQYEDVKLRNRIQFGYATSSCPPMEEFSRQLKETYKTDYMMLAVTRCAAPKNYKGFTVWDVANEIDNKNFLCSKHLHNLQRFCFRVQLESSHFDMLYRNGKYAIFKRKENVENLPTTPYEEFDWKNKVTDITAWEPWIKNCIANDSRCGLDICDYARQLLDMYSLPQAADTLYKRALELYPNDKDVLFHYAEYLDYDLKDTQKAKDYYKRAVYADLSNVRNVVEYSLFLDQAVDRKSTYEEAGNVLISLAERLEEKKIEEFELSDTSAFCKAASEIASLIYDSVAGGIKPEERGRWTSAMKFYWNLAKRLDINDSCVTENWQTFEGHKKTDMEILAHFFFY